jgi:hypothetical protein
VRRRSRLAAVVTSAISRLTRAVVQEGLQVRDHRAEDRYGRRARCAAPAILTELHSILDATEAHFWRPAAKHGPPPSS